MDQRSEGRNPELKLMIAAMLCLVARPLCRFAAPNCVTCIAGETKAAKMKIQRKQSNQLG